MISSVIFSLRAMINDKRSTRYLSWMFVIVLGSSLATAFLTAAIALVLKPGTIGSAERRSEIGHVLNGSLASYNTSTTLEERSNRPAGTNVLELVLEVIPSNIFGALTVGNTLQVLIFSILFVIARGTLPFDASGMAGVITAAHLSIIYDYLGLPLEAAFILLLAVETIADSLRTLTLIATISAATASIVPAPQVEERLPAG
jgi:Na+/H+-dicarboxylate symporter